MTTELNVGTRVSDEEGACGVVMAVAKGRVTVQMDDGETRKFKVAQLTEVVEPEQPPEPEGEPTNEGGEPEGDEPEGDEGGESAEPTGRAPFRGDRLKANKAQYVKQRHCGDDVATALDTATLEGVLQQTRDWGLYNPKWEVLNDGQKRMNAGNRIRAYIKKAKDEDKADLLAALRNLPQKPEEWHVMRNGNPVARRASKAEAEAEMALMKAKPSSGDAQFRVQPISVTQAQLARARELAKKDAA